MNERRTKIALQRVDGDEQIVFRVESRRWMKTQMTELCVSASGLQAMGDLGGYRHGTLNLPWERVAELHYGPAGRGAIEGLYAREGGWCSRCVLPWVSETQAEEVIAAIAVRHPRLAANREGALETAIAEAMARKALTSRGWTPSLVRRGAVAIATGRV